MSFDLFAQLFINGQASAVGIPEVLDVLRPFVVVGPEEDGFCRTRTADGGEADFYLGSGTGGFMVNHFSKGQTSDVIYRAASSRGLVLFGPETPAMLTDRDQRMHLPKTLASGPRLPVLVISGSELEDLIADDAAAYERSRERLEARP